jgi:protein-disulfide isomerase-like protein with CxxC motif
VSDDPAVRVPAVSAAAGAEGNELLTCAAAVVLVTGSRVAGGRTRFPILLSMQRVRVIHFSDPGCPWAYSARPAHARLRWRFGDQLDWQLVLIGLSETTERYESRGYTPAAMVAGHRSFRDRFGMPFGLRTKPRLAPTTRACRAIAAVRDQDPERADAALRALQLLQFTTDGVLDDDAHLRDALATVPGVDADAAVACIDDPEIVARYEADKALTRSAEGGATHAQDRHSTSDGPVRFTAPSLVFERNGSRLEAGGFQPFEAYDLMLANLAPDLERRPAPHDAAAVLEAFPLGVTTAEVASVLRPTDLADPDRDAAEAELFALAAAGRATREPLGQDALWRAA